MEKVIAVFDVGKTNKKVLLFNTSMKLIFQHEEKFPTTIDEDGFECDDIQLITNWIKQTIVDLVRSHQYILSGINFSTYGASLAFLDQKGQLLTPIYNYLKPVSEQYQKDLFDRHGGEEEFCRQTASPALGVLLNSGIQMIWLKHERPDVFSKCASVLHFPQYLSNVLTNKVVSEYTSIGCHTFMWDFDHMSYHNWLSELEIELPLPVPNDTTYDVEVEGIQVPVGVGIHDSSASLVPYFMGSRDKFLLISTGTWCINMNPFNSNPLTAEQLKNDCLCYLSVNQQPVKSSRLFMGHIHDVNTALLVKFFNVAPNSYKKVKTDSQIILNLLKGGELSTVFFKNGIPSGYVDESVDLSQFASFSDAYHHLMYDLTLQCVRSIRLVSDVNDGVKQIFVSGGFARNEIFVRLLGNFLPEKKVFTSQVDNSSALGAALIIGKKLGRDFDPQIDLGLVEWDAFK